MSDSGQVRLSMTVVGLLFSCAEPPADTEDPIIEQAGRCRVSVGLHGGRALSRPAVVNAYWGRYWETPLAADTAFLAAGTIPGRAWDDAWSRLAAWTAFWAPLLEYGVGIGSWGGSGMVEEDDVGAARVPEEKIQRALERAIATGRLPERADGIYVVYLPPGMTAEADYFGFGDWPVSAHHGYYDRPDGSRRIYAVVEAWSATMGGHSVAASHEIAEAATDPDFVGYWDATTGDEVADLCVGVGTLLADGSSPTAEFFFRVHGVWSQESCECAGVAL